MKSLSSTTRTDRQNEVNSALNKIMIRDLNRKDKKRDFILSQIGYNLFRDKSQKNETIDKYVKEKSKNDDNVEMTRSNSDSDLTITEEEESWPEK